MPGDTRQIACYLRLFHRLCCKSGLQNIADLPLSPWVAFAGNRLQSGKILMIPGARSASIRSDCAEIPITCRGAPKLIPRPRTKRHALVAAALGSEEHHPDDSFTTSSPMAFLVTCDGVSCSFALRRVWNVGSISLIIAGCNLHQSYDAKKSLVLYGKGPLVDPVELS